MRVKTRLIISALPLLMSILNTKRLGRKITKQGENANTKYPTVWRNKYLIKKMRKLARLVSVNLKVKGYENIPKGNVILVPNHASGFDPVLVLLALENKSKEADANTFIPLFLGKSELADLWWAKGYAQLNNTFFIDRADPRSALSTIDNMIEHAKAERKVVVIFPEGTRSIDGTLGEFKGGAFFAAKKHFLTIVPVTINNAIGISDLKRPRRPKHEVELVFHKPIKPMQFMMMDTPSIGRLVQKVIASALTKPTRERGASEKRIVK